jgi:5-methylcytosine-specific restriction endonuclease McrA
VSGRTRSALSEKIKRAVLLRDGHCRAGTCDVRDGLQVHHLLPVSWGGTDDPSNLATVCARGSRSHHPLLVPYGDWVLEGNPNQPDGLRFVHISQATQVRPPPGWQRGRRIEPPAA